MYSKGNSKFLLGARKGDYSKLLGGVKSLVRDPLFQEGLSLVAPEVGFGLKLANKSGLLKKM
jgi:hypothetical protein